MRNILVTLMLSQGTPMLSHGDEIGRTQGGNNNAYCQDNEITWIDWSAAGQYNDVLEFTRKVTALRTKHPVFRRRRFFDGRRSKSGHNMRDIYWLTRDGVEMTSDDWHSGIKSVAVGLNGEALPEPDARGERIVDDSFLLCFNAHAYPVDFAIPETPYAREWKAIIDTFDPRGATEQYVAAGTTMTVQGRSVVVLQKTA
jgi:glycogen operon protein